MIYTITLNPCLDRHLLVEDLQFDDANRIQEETRYAAGKGVDVSVVLKELGTDSLALGFVGGYSGLEFEGMLINRGIPCDFTQIGQDTRTNIHITNRRTGGQTSLNARGPFIKAVELGLFCQKVRHLSPKPSFVSMNGSLPQGVTAGIYRQLTHWLKEQGARIVLDADGEAFAQGVEAGPYLVKPNVHELGRYLKEDLQNHELSQLVPCCRRVQQRGVEIVALSLGPRGLLVTWQDRALHATTPPVQSVSTVGAGDSVIAGMLYKLAAGRDLREAVRWGAACGTATALTPGTELCKREGVLQILDKVTLQEIS